MKKTSIYAATIAAFLSISTSHSADAVQSYGSASVTSSRQNINGFAYFIFKAKFYNSAGKLVGYNDWYFPSQTTCAEALYGPNVWNHSIISAIVRNDLSTPYPPTIQIPANRIKVLASSECPGSGPATVPIVPQRR